MQEKSVKHPSKKKYPSKKNIRVKSKYPSKKKKKSLSDSNF